MKLEKRLVKVIAKNYRVDPVVLTLALWEYPKSGYFDYIRNENTPVKIKDLSLVKSIIFTKFLKNDVLVIEKEDSQPIKLIIKDFDFSQVGRLLNPIWYLTKNEVLKIHDELASDFKTMEDPISPAGLRDEGLLESALHHPQTSFVSSYKYPTLESSAAALFYSLTHNHAFHNGNKRTAMVSVLVFLDRHGMFLQCDENELFRVALALADHKLLDEEYRYPDAEINALAIWIHRFGKNCVNGERRVTFRKLKQILGHFDCEILSNGKVKRSIPGRGYFGRSKYRILYTKKAFGVTLSEGSEVSLKLIKSMREDLELVSTHNIDSDKFYKQANFSSSDFIVKYKNLLRRLSKV